MQKVLFSSENAQKISKDAFCVCDIYNNLAHTSISRIEFLNAIANMFGYDSGWSEFMAINKSERFYISFSLSTRSHVRAVLDKLLSYLPSHADPELLLISVSFVELGLKRPEHIAKIQGKGTFKKENEVIWLGSNSNTPLRHLAVSREACLLEKEGIIVKHFEMIWPELCTYIAKGCELSPEDVLLFDKPIWALYFERIKNEYQDTEIGQWEVHFKKSRNYARVCYCPLYSVEDMKPLSGLANDFIEGLPGCPPVEHFGAEMDDETYIDSCIAYWKSLDCIDDIRLSFREEYTGTAQSSLFDFLELYKTSHNKRMDKIKSRVATMNFAEDTFVYEPRFVYGKSGVKKIYQEPWIVGKDVCKLIELNDTIHQYTFALNIVNLPVVNKQISIYRRELFAPLFPLIGIGS